MRKVVILFLILFSVVGLTSAYLNWPSIQERFAKETPSAQQQAQAIAQAKELLNRSQPEEALAIIQEHSDEIDSRTDQGREWLDLLIRASEATLDTPQLLVLYNYSPKSFDGHEKAALMIANAFLAEGRTQDYQTLRSNWVGREALPETWFVLDGDKLLNENKRKEAIELLTSRTFPGKADTGRLMRLSLLYVFDQPKTAWDYLTQAYAKDPENPEIRSYRAKLLETVGKENLALSEYTAATQLDPTNLYLKDQLAEFFLRTKQVPLALQLWMQNLNPPTQDFIWLKTLFWSKVAVPVSFDWSKATPPDGKLEPLVAYLLTLKPATYWDTYAFERVANGQQYLKTQQATFWLRLFEALKQGKENESYDLLVYNPFQSVSWNAPLEEALKKILHYRKTGQLVPVDRSGNLDVALSSKPLPPFYEQLNQLAQTHAQIPADLHELLIGPEAFTAALLATGWNEAALNLHTLKILPKSYPEWVGLSLTQALKENRGAPAALGFASIQNQTPALALAVGELLIATNNYDAALDQLAKLMYEDSDLGMRAAWWVSLISVERGQYTEARAAIAAQPRLSYDVVGQETLARIALLEGNEELANQIYSTLEDKSLNAKSYLARRAFADKDWRRARELTEQLLRSYPDNAMLQENLKRIVAEQNKL